MKQSIQVFRASKSLWSRFLESNPQLFREIKGRLKTRNIIIAAAVSVITQFIVVVPFLGDFPSPDPNGMLGQQDGRYGLGAERYTSNIYIYTKDLLGNWIINWQLFWLDVFVAISIISIFSLIIFGSYLLVADVVKEENKGTFNFIRLSPQSAGSILLGKIIGVPILLYASVLLAFPLHLAAGLGARIPLNLIIGFDATIITGCGFFYSLALFFSLVKTSSPGLSGFKPWLVTGAWGFFLVATTLAIFERHMELDHPFGWFFLLNPHLVLIYLINSTHLPSDSFTFMPIDELQALTFYGQALWTNASLGIGFILFHLGVGTYWCWSVLKRRFHNPEGTLIGKIQSYWLTGWLVVFALGFTLQNTHSNVTNSGIVSDLGAWFIVLRGYLCVWGAILVAALSPHRQTLYDWSRYRHQISKNGKIWRELVFADNSPSTVAIAINLAMAIAYITPAIFIHLNNTEQFLIFLNLILAATSILFCGLVAQLILTIKSRKRIIWSLITVAAMVIVPPICLGFAGIDPYRNSLVWAFTLVPIFTIEKVAIPTLLMALFGQCLVISVAGLVMTRKLKQAGESETKAFFSQQSTVKPM